MLDEEDWQDNNDARQTAPISSAMTAEDVSIEHSDNQIECGFGIGGSEGQDGESSFLPSITVVSDREGLIDTSAGIDNDPRSIRNDDDNRAEEDDHDRSNPRSDLHSNRNPESGDNDRESGMSLEELIYGASSFHAIVKPVSITMILAALAVIYINTEETKQQGEAALDKSYQVFTISDDQTAATSLGLSLVNSLIIVSVIGGMTFVLVLLYKYRCMKFLMGYMCLASTVLLGFLGGQMFYVAINKYQLAIDNISFYFTMYNFAAVGTLAVFYEKGIPKYINQAYLIATSVIVAWQLSYFNDWMAWALLVMLALYDLFAVLTPCGPLKALVNLMQKDDAPAMPGLLYEAQLPEGATRPGRRGRKNRADENGNPTEAEDETANNAISNQHVSSAISGVSENGVVETTPHSTNKNLPRVPSRQHRKKQSTHPINNTAPSAASSPNNTDQISNTSSSTPTEDSTHVKAFVPLAIAKVYKLPLISPGVLSEIISIETSRTAYLEQQFSSLELRTDVEVKFPRRGGKIETTYNNKNEPRYVVYNKDGEIKRTLLVNKGGKVMEEVAGEDGDSAMAQDNTIKLGLGDFIFYSVLVSKAAEYGFAAFVACFLSILTGLGGTLVLLAVYHHALPALPISIFLAVVFYLLTIYCMEPWIQDMFQVPYYV